MHIVKEELLEVKRKYADARRSMIVPGENDIDLEDLIARDICVIPLSATGYIKRVPASEYEAQHRGGKGVRGMRTKDEDYVSLLLTCCTHDIIMFFTNKGQMRWLKGYEIPEGTRDSQGKALVNLLELQEGEKVRAMIPVADMEQGGYVVMATKNGTVKKTELAAFKHLRKPGIIAIKLEEDDDLIDAQLTSGEDEILLLAANGMACRFDEKDIRSMGRNSIGVRGMELRDSEGKLASELVAMSIVDPEDELLLVTAQGMGKRVPIGQGSNIVEDESEENVGETLEVDSNRRFRRTRRGAKGVISIRLRAGDSVVAALQVPANSKQELLLISVNGQTVRLRVQDVRLVGRAGVGVIVMRLYENDLVATATIVDELSEEEIAANQAKAEEDANLAVIEAHFQDRENPAPANDEDEEPDENEETDQPE